MADVTDIKALARRITDNAQFKGLHTVVFIRDGKPIDEPTTSNAGKAVMAAINKGDMRGIAGVYTHGNVAQLAEDIAEAKKNL